MTNRIETNKSAMQATVNCNGTEALESRKLACTAENDKDTGLQPDLTENERFEAVAKQILCRYIGAFKALAE